MDLSALNDKDLAELARGNLSGMSDAGFAALIQAREKSMPMADKQARAMEIDRQKYNPTTGMSTGNLVAAAAGKPIADAGRALQQLVGNYTREQADEQKRLDAPLMATTPGKVGYALGVGGMGIPAAMLPGAGTVLGGGAYGGLLGSLTPVGEGDNALGNALTGAMFGAGTNAALKTAKVGLGGAATPEARALAQRGVQLTPGQQMGGAVSRIEQGAESIPVLGDVIRNARVRSMESFNTVVANEALKPIGNKLPKGVTGRDAVNYVESKIGDVYESAIKRTGSVKADGGFVNELANLKNMVRQSPLPDEIKRQFDSVIENQITGKLQGQTAMTAQTFKQADSEVGRLAAKYMSDASADKQMLGDALEETQAIMRRWLQRTAPPDVSKDVAAANAGWAQFKRMQRAASAIGSADGIFSPEQYRSAIRALDPSKDKGAFARGSALGQDLAENAVSVMGRQVPDSGTPLRTLVTHPVQGLLTGVATAPLQGVYASPRAQAALQALLSGKRPALATKAAAELEMLAPWLSQGSATYGIASQRVGQ